VTALEAVLIPVVEPILNPVWVFLVRGERPSPWALVGGVIVLAAVTWRALFAIRQRKLGLTPAGIAGSRRVDVAEKNCVT
jgi:drug/metabolite transporter (DMT)-like permease